MTYQPGGVRRKLPSVAKTADGVGNWLFCLFFYKFKEIVQLRGQGAKAPLRTLVLYKLCKLSEKPNLSR